MFKALVVSIICLATESFVDRFVKENGIERKNITIKYSPHLSTGEPDEQYAEDFATIKVLKKLEFRGSALEPGSTFLVGSDNGLKFVETPGASGTMIFDGVTCSRRATFHLNEFCFCKLAREFKVDNRNTIPSGFEARFAKGKLVFFRPPFRVSSGSDLKEPGISSPTSLSMMVGGIPVEERKVYQIKDGKAVKAPNLLSENPEICAF